MRFLEIYISLLFIFFLIVSLFFWEGRAGEFGVWNWIAIVYMSWQFVGSTYYYLKGY